MRRRCPHVVLELLRSAKATLATEEPDHPDEQEQTDDGSDNCSSDCERYEISFCPSKTRANLEAKLTRSRVALLAAAVRAGRRVEGDPRRQGTVDDLTLVVGDDDRGKACHG